MKSSKVEMKKGDVVGMCVLSSVLSVFLMVGAIYLAQPFIFQEAVSESVFRDYKEVYEDDPYLVEVIELCIVMNSDYDKVSCVNEYFKDRFDYTDRGDGDMLSPTTIFTEGGLCRDAASFYCSAFNELGMDCRFLFRGNDKENSPDTDHVLAVVWLKDRFLDVCLVDMDDMWCA